VRPLRVPGPLQGFLGLEQAHLLEFLLHALFHLRVVGVDELLITEIVQNVFKDRPVLVEEDVAVLVFNDGHFTLDDLVQVGTRDPLQSLGRCGEELTTDIEVDNLWVSISKEFHLLLLQLLFEILLLFLEIVLHECGESLSQ